MWQVFFTKRVDCCAILKEISTCWINMVSRLHTIWTMTFQNWVKYSSCSHTESRLISPSSAKKWHSIPLGQLPPPRSVGCTFLMKTSKPPFLATYVMSSCGFGSAGWSADRNWAQVRLPLGCHTFAYLCTQVGRIRNSAVSPPTCATNATYGPGQTVLFNPSAVSNHGKCTKCVACWYQSPPYFRIRLLWK
jgi:hypothetical protein